MQSYFIAECARQRRETVAAPVNSKSSFHESRTACSLGHSRDRLHLVADKVYLGSRMKQMSIMTSYLNVQRGAGSRLRQSVDPVNAPAQPNDETSGFQEQTHELVTSSTNTFED